MNSIPYFIDINIVYLKKITYSDMKIRAKKGICRKLFLHNCDITDSDGMQVPIDQIFKLYPGLERYQL